MKPTTQDGPDHRLDAAPTPDPYAGSGRKGLALAFGSMAAVAITIILAFNFAGRSAPDESQGDITYIAGKGEQTVQQQPAATVADIVSADVSREGDDLVFSSELATEVPKRFADASMELRWTLYEDGDASWLVVATINIAPQASVVSQHSPYGSSTIDQTLPGTIEVLGEVVEVRIRSGEIDKFPDEFDWQLESMLLTDRRQSRSARLVDRLPDEGTTSFQI